MRISEIRRVDLEDVSLIHVQFVQDNGITGELQFEMPDTPPASWREWGRQQIADALQDYRMGEVGEVLWPDQSRPQAAKTDFENLPRWATWSIAEARAYIDANVTDLASAKAVLQNIAAALLYIRDIVIER